MKKKPTEPTTELATELTTNTTEVVTEVVVEREPVTRAEVASNIELATTRAERDALIAERDALAAQVGGLGAEVDDLREALTAERESHASTERRIDALQERLTAALSREEEREKVLDTLSPGGDRFGIGMVLSGLKAGQRFTRPSWHGRTIHFDATQNLIMRTATPGAVDGAASPWAPVSADLLATDYEHLGPR